MTLELVADGYATARRDGARAAGRERALRVITVQREWLDALERRGYLEPDRRGECADRARCDRAVPSLNRSLKDSPIQPDWVHLHH
jgi:hypothetical protein